MLKRSDVEAYLCVLGYPPPGNHSQNITGCLCRLEDQIRPLTYDDKEWRALEYLLKYRERLNGFLPHEHPYLAAATKQLAEALSALLERADVLC